jgi:hypothetical protein
MRLLGARRTAVRIIAYTLVTSNGNEADIETATVVNEYLSKGWQPLGGVSVCPDPEGDGLFKLVYAQALVRYAEDPDAHPLAEDAHVLARYAEEVTMSKPQMPTNLPKMPTYLCHKEVQARKILTVERQKGQYSLVLIAAPGAREPRVDVDSSWIDHFGPRAGDYLVVYGAGTAEEYVSVSPAKQFEEGYTLAE